MGIGNYIIIGLGIFVFFWMLIEVRHKVLVGKLENRLGTISNDWKWGIFDFNPSDPRIFVPKRIESLGRTLNFARPGYSIFLLAIILFAIMVKML